MNLKKKKNQAAGFCNSKSKERSWRCGINKLHAINTSLMIKIDTKYKRGVSITKKNILMSEHGADWFENVPLNLLQHVTQSKSTDYAKLDICEWFGSRASTLTVGRASLIVLKDTLSIFTNLILRGTINFDFQAPFSFRVLWWWWWESLGKGKKPRTPLFFFSLPGAARSRS